MESDPCKFERVPVSYKTRDKPDLKVAIEMNLIL